MSTKLLPPTLAAVLLGSTAVADVPSVAVDIAPLHSIVTRVMQGVGTPDLVIPPSASSHEYRLRPSEARALQNADVVFWMGEDMTPWLDGAIETLAINATATALLETKDTMLLEFREGALFEAHDHDDHGDDDHDEHHGDHGDDDHDDDHDEHGDDDHDDDHDEHGDDDHDEHHDDHGDDDHDEHHDEHGDDDHDEHHDDHGDDDHDDDHDEHGDDHHDDHGDDDHDEDHDDHGHGAHDPHAWLSPDNARTWMNVIAAELSAADPENAGAYFANAAAGRAEIEVLKGEISAVLEPVRGVSFVVFHDAYQYFESAFDISASGAISLGDASDPSPARIAEIQDRVRDEGIDCVLSEPQFNPGIVAVVMDGTDAKTGVIDPLGSDLEVGANLYPQLLRNLATTLAGCM
jgi:zinc transport system substrate-binding protein